MTKTTKISLFALVILNLLVTILVYSKMGRRIKLDIDVGQNYVYELECDDAPVSKTPDVS